MKKIINVLPNTTSVCKNIRTMSVNSPTINTVSSPYMSRRHTTVIQGIPKS